VCWINWPMPSWPPHVAQTLRASSSVPERTLPVAATTALGGALAKDAERFADFDLYFSAAVVTALITAKMTQTIGTTTPICLMWSSPHDFCMIRACR
jgi:hypothetical protein